MGEIKMKRLPITLLMFCLLFSPMPLWAEMPNVMRYQGVIKDADGQPITDTLTIQFAIYDSENGGNQLWYETLNDVEAIEGRFNVILGEENPITFDLFGGQTPYFLSLTVQGDAEMLPRHALTANTFAGRSVIAEAAKNVRTDEQIAALVSRERGLAERGALIDQDPTTTPVTWLDITDIPYGFADGEDLTKSDAEIIAFVNSADYQTAADATDIVTFTLLESDYYDIAAFDARLPDYYDREAFDALLPDYADENHTHDEYAAIDHGHTLGEMTDAPFSCLDGETIVFEAASGDWVCNMNAIDITSIDGLGINVSDWRLSLVDNCPYGNALIYRERADNDGGNLPDGEWLCEDVPASFTLHPNGGLYEDGLNQLSLKQDCADGHELHYNALTGGWVCTDNQKLTETQVDGFADNEGYAKAAELNDGNTATTPVDWAGLIDLPQSMADGTDEDTTYTGNDFGLSGNACAAGQLMNGFEADGNPACVTDDDTTYTSRVGYGIEFSGTQIGLDTSCINGNVLRWDNAQMEWVCSNYGGGGFVTWNDLTTWGNVIHVAPEGGDYPSIQAAITAATPSVTSPVLVKVAPGKYAETFTLKPYLRVEGSGIGRTIIETSATAGWTGSFVAGSYVVVMDSDSAISDVTIVNTGTTDAIGGIGFEMKTNVLIENVEVNLMGAAPLCYGLEIWDNSSAVIRNSTFKAQSCTDHNTGILIRRGVTASIYDTTSNTEGNGSVDSVAVGILFYGESGYDTYVDIVDSSFHAEAAQTNYGLQIGDYAYGNVYSSTILAENGTTANGVFSDNASNAKLALHTTSVVAKNGTNYSNALYLENPTEIYACEIRGVGGNVARGVYLTNSISLTSFGSTLSAEGAGSANVGIENYATVNLYSTNVSTQSPSTKSILNSGDGFTMIGGEIMHASSSSNTAGFYNSGTTAFLQGVSIQVNSTGSNAYGVQQLGAGADMTIINADVTVEGASSTNAGMHVSAETVNIDGGRFHASGGTSAWGVSVQGANVTLNGASVEASGATGANIGLKTESSTSAAEVTAENVDVTADGGESPTAASITKNTAAMTFLAKNSNFVAKSGTIRGIGVMASGAADVTLKGSGVDVQDCAEGWGVEATSSEDTTLDNCTVIVNNCANAVAVYGKDTAKVTVNQGVYRIWDDAGTTAYGFRAANASTQMMIRNPTLYIESPNAGKYGVYSAATGITIQGGLYEITGVGVKYGIMSSGLLNATGAKIVVSGTSGETSGIAHSSGDANLRDIRIELNHPADSGLSGLHYNASGKLMIAAGVTIRASVDSGTGYGVKVENGTLEMYESAIVIDGESTSATGVYGAYIGDIFEMYNSSIQAEAANANSIGLYAGSGTDTEMHQCAVTAGNGGDFATGVHIDQANSFIGSQNSVTAIGGDTNTVGIELAATSATLVGGRYVADGDGQSSVELKGISVIQGSATLIGLTAEAKNQGSDPVSTGIDVSGTSTSVDIAQCFAKGEDFSISEGATTTVTVANSRLGTVVNGNVACQSKVSRNNSEEAGGVCP